MICPINNNPKEGRVAEVVSDKDIFFFLGRTFLLSRDDPKGTWFLIRCSNPTEVLQQDLYICLRQLWKKDSYIGEKLGR